jgi:cytochrome oxidase Cu insertion factor (SCO1/SenC/PrrC family)
MGFGFSMHRGLAACAVGWALGGCAPALSPAQPAFVSRAEAPANQAGASLFAYPWVWTDELGRQVAFSRWRGETLVVSAFYASCKSTCPRTIGKLQKIQEAFRREGRAAQFVLVTLDPTTDTTEILRNLKVSAGFPETWHLLAGSVPQTRDLTDVLDIHIIDDGPHLMHDAKIVVFDERGRATRSFGGWALDNESKLR